MIRLYDGNNYFISYLQSDPTGMTPRVLYEKMKHCKETCIWVWDPPNNKQKRLEVYSQYKANRTPPAENLYSLMNMFKVLLECICIPQITVPEYEADDVIATLADNIAETHSVGIFSSDYDFAQLIDDPNIICGAKLKENVTAKDIRLYKTIVGDPADNIKGVPGVGDKTWDKLDKIKLHDYIHTLDISKLSGSGLKSRHIEWMGSNASLLAAYWTVVGFYNVPRELINENINLGLLDTDKAEFILNKYLFGDPN